MRFVGCLNRSKIGSDELQKINGEWYKIELKKFKTAENGKQRSNFMPGSLIGRRVEEDKGTGWETREHLATNVSVLQH